MGLIISLFFPWIYNDWTDNDSLSIGPVGTNTSKIPTKTPENDFENAV